MYSKFKFNFSMFNPQILDNEIKIAQPKKRLQLWLGLL